MCNRGGNTLILDCTDILHLDLGFLRVMSGGKIAEEDDINNIGESKESQT